MSAVSETIVREYFELQGFFVRQQRKYISPSRREDDEIDFFVLNPRVAPSNAPLPFQLSSKDLASISRAVVVVKAWHTESFAPSVVVHAPEIFRFLEPTVFQHAARAFGQDGPITKVLVVPALTPGEEARQQTIELLRAKGIDAVIPFHTMLSELIDQIEVNRNYQKSDLFQIIRILKNYDFLKDQQLELFNPKRSQTTLSSVESASADSHGS